MDRHSILARYSRRLLARFVPLPGVGDGATAMSEAKQTHDEPEEEVTKKVDIVCYLKNPDELTRRQFADEMAPARDMFQREEVTNDNRSVYLEAGGRREKLYQADPDYILEHETGDMNFEIEGSIETEQAYVHDPLNVVKSHFSDVIVDSYDEERLSELGWLRRSGTTIADENYNRKLRFTYEFVRMPMLKHKSEIRPDSMYVDPDEDYLAVKIRATIISLPRDQFDVVNDEFLGGAMKALARDDRVGKVRVYDCESETKEQGVCFNI